MYIASCLRRNRFSAARSDGDRRRRYRKIIASTKTEHTVRTNVRIRTTPDDIETASHKRRRRHAAIQFMRSDKVFAAGGLAIVDWEFCVSGNGLIDIGNFFRFSYDYEASA